MNAERLGDLLVAVLAGCMGGGHGIVTIGAAGDKDRNRRRRWPALRSRDIYVLAIASTGRLSVKTGSKNGVTT